MENKLNNPYLKIKNNIIIGKTKSNWKEIIVLGKQNSTVKTELSKIIHNKQEIQTVTTENNYVMTIPTEILYSKRYKRNKLQEKKNLRQCHSFGEIT